MYLCATGTEWCSFLATGCWLLCVVAVLVSGQGSTTSMIMVIGVFHLVCRLWMWGVVLRTLGSLGLLDDGMPVSALFEVWLCSPYVVVYCPPSVLVLCLPFVVDFRIGFLAIV